MTGTSELFAALSDAIATCGSGVGKDKQAQGYKFRGIDQILNFLNPILARHKLALVPTTISDAVVVERQAKSGGVLYFARARVLFTLYHASGGSIPVEVWSEAMDSSDKALNKVMSVAWKYAAIQTFCIPVEDVADENPHKEDMAPTRREPARWETEQAQLGDHAGMLLKDMSPTLLTQYLEQVERHVKTHPELAAAERDAWRKHYAAAKQALDNKPDGWGLK